MNRLQSSSDLHYAIQDLLLLLNKAYPLRTSFQLVSNRYHLNKINRIILYRGVFPLEIARARKNKKVRNIQGQILWIDTLNVLYILSGYLKGLPVFICLDGILRDAGEAFSKNIKKDLLERVIGWLNTYLQASHTREIHFVLDSPGIITERASTILQFQFQSFPVPYKLHFCKKADTLLKKIQQGIIATSDSAILDHVSLSYIDLPYEILMNEFAPDFLSVQKMLD